MAVTSDQIVTEIHSIVRPPAIATTANCGSYEVVWYWKVVPVDPGTAFEGIRGYAQYRDEADRLIKANVANVLENGVTGIATVTPMVVGVTTFAQLTIAQLEAEAAAGISTVAGIGSTSVGIGSTSAGIATA